jgi:hypothetical protein
MGPGSSGTRRQETATKPTAQCTCESSPSKDGHAQEPKSSSGSIGECIP